MLEIKIPKEINKYEIKLIGPFSGRQAICIACMAVVNITTFKLCSSILPRDIILMICVLLSIPFPLLGWVKVYGMHFDKFFFSIVKTMFLAPKVRKYKTYNYYEELQKEIIKSETTNKKKVKKQKYIKSKKAFK